VRRRDILKHIRLNHIHPIHIRLNPEPYTGEIAPWEWAEETDAALEVETQDITIPEGGTLPISSRITLPISSRIFLFVDFKRNISHCRFQAEHFLEIENLGRDMIPVIS